ncbi:CatA-like O-acetyltransferase [Desulfitobacterium dehalogenans]|uniref:CatA-like O-acetyltransferase n=1 Tax=Desulfitobacterium dehalogenans TaxID=36854 RepID=UPI00067FE6CF
MSKAKEFAFYPLVLYMASVGVNAQMELRTYVNESGVVGYWEQVHPSYTNFHKNTHTFSTLWTEYSKEFKVFYHNYQVDMHLYGNDHGYYKPFYCIVNFEFHIKKEAYILLPFLFSLVHFLLLF